MSDTTMEITSGDLRVYYVFKNFMREKAESDVKKQLSNVKSFSICPSKESQASYSSLHGHKPVYEYDKDSCYKQALSKNRYEDFIEGCKSTYKQYKNTDDGKTLDENQVQELREKAHIMMTTADLATAVIRGIQTGCNLKWVQIVSAGVHSLFEVKEVIKKCGIIVTRMGEGYGELISQYVMGQILAKEMNFREFDKEQKRKDFAYSRAHFSNRYIERPVKFFSALTIGVMGVGCIGGRVAEICKKFGMTVYRLRRSKLEKGEWFDSVFHTSDLKQFLEGTDYICNTLPSTPETRDLLSNDILQHCSVKKPVFVNVGRGNIIAEDALLKALNNDWLSGAILDVLPREPLPSDSQLWEHHKVVITPHLSGAYPTDVWAKVFASNYTQFLEKKRMD